MVSKYCNYDEWPIVYSNLNVSYEQVAKHVEFPSIDLEARVAIGKMAGIMGEKSLQSLESVFSYCKNGSAELSQGLRDLANTFAETRVEVARIYNEVKEYLSDEVTAMFDKVQAVHDPVTINQLSTPTSFLLESLGSELDKQNNPRWAGYRRDVSAIKAEFDTRRKEVPEDVISEIEHASYAIDGYKKAKTQMKSSGLLDVQRNAQYNSRGVDR